MFYGSRGPLDYPKEVMLQEEMLLLGSRVLAPRVYASSEEMLATIFAEYSKISTPQPGILSRGKAGGSGSWSLGKATEMKNTLHSVDRPFSNETKMENAK
ncbi:Mediator Of Rna polymerase Ii Transcription Subunit 13-Like [Manis pentadactyla]|nr:Mediator Of Rna polymerase Ii Transcription Subunit 13-Like [Manis pentadactyla]